MGKKMYGMRGCMLMGMDVFLFSPGFCSTDTFVSLRALCVKKTINDCAFGVSNFGHPRDFIQEKNQRGDRIIDLNPCAKAQPRRGDRIIDLNPCAKDKPRRDDRIIAKNQGRRPLY
jgi:hypothetical protein